MTKLRVSIRALVLILLCFALASAAAATDIVIVDENGHGTFNGGSLPFNLGQLPLGGGLAYDLPFAVVPGELAMFAIEPQSQAALLPSDLITFVDSPTTGLGTLFFLSDAETPDQGDLADTFSFPLPPYPNALEVLELGPDGANGLVYTPIAGQPGFVAGAEVTYNIISDVQEPGTFAMLAFGLGLATVIGRRCMHNRGSQGPL
jgi:hypothetical protein